MKEPTKRFRTIEISDPAFESDHLRFITVKTPHLKGRGDICVFVPPETTKTDLPIVLLLHGVYGSAWAWSQKGGAHLTALRLIEEKKIPPVILAMPSDGLWGDGSGYLPHSSYDFEKWIAYDVPDAVKMNIPQASKSDTTFISGLSMGGYGALRIGAKYSQIFSAISAHSAITSLKQMNLFVEEPLHLYRQADPTEEDVFLTIQQNRTQLPPLRFDCGRSDLLIDYNRRLHQSLERVKINHLYQEFDGGHEWSYWYQHLERSLMFFAKFA